MNSPVNKYTRINECDFSTGKCKKRKRHRNRYKNYILRKKKLKKFPFSKTGVKKSDTFNCRPDSEKIMSSWYWSNYRKAVEWQEKHKVAHWKACALALFEENRYLLEIINHMRPRKVSETLVTPQAVVRGTNFKSEQRMKYSDYFPGFAQSNVDKDNCYTKRNESNIGNRDGDTEEIEDFEFEMSEEMMKFFEQSYRHKMDMKKLKEKELINDVEQQVQLIQSNKINRSSEMNFLYGDGASMITGMETAVQLSFNKYCDINSPNYWPNIPFRL